MTAAFGGQTVYFFMEGVAVEVDLSDLVDFLHQSLKSMVSKQMILKSAANSISISDLVHSLVAILRKSLQSEREQYLLSLLYKCDDLHRTQDNIELEFAREQSQHIRRMRKLATEREELKQRREYLLGDSESRDINYARKENRAQVNLTQKERAFANIYKAIDLAEATYEQLHSDVADLKSVALKAQRIQKKLIREAKSLCTDELQRVVDEMNANRQGIYDRRLSELRTELASERNEQKRLASACEAVIRAVRAMPSARKFEMEVSEFPHRVDEIIAIVDQAVADEERRANVEVKKELVREIPGMRFGRNEAVGDAVERYIEEKVAEKQSECEEVLRKGAERERKLREKLDEALTKIQRLQGSRDADVIEASEIDRKQNSWLEQKRRLDETMAAIEKMRSSSSSFASLTRGSDTE